MSNSLKVGFLLLLITLAGSWSLLGLYASQDATAANRVQPTQRWVPQDLSGSYEGVIYIRDKKKKNFLMVGSARLVINGEELTLSRMNGEQLVGNPIIGKITTFIITEKENLGVGEIELENAGRIEIRWHRNKDLNILKIVCAKGTKYLFRFCTANLKTKQCVGRIS